MLMKIILISVTENRRCIAYSYFSKFDSPPSNSWILVPLKWSSPEHYVWFSQFWSHLRGTMHCLPQRLKSTFFERLKSTFFENFSSLQVSFGDPPLEFFSKNVDFSLFPCFNSLYMPFAHLSQNRIDDNSEFFFGTRLVYSSRICIASENILKCKDGSLQYT